VALSANGLECEAGLRDIHYTPGMELQWCTPCGFLWAKNCVGDEEGRKESRGRHCTWAVGWVMSTIEACVASRQCTYTQESLPRSLHSLVKPGKIVVL